MSAIYGDPTLGANLKFVILRLIFYEGGVAAAEEEEEGAGQPHLDNLRFWFLFCWFLKTYFGLNSPLDK